MLRICSLALAALLSGCSTLPNQIEQLGTAASCCVTPSHFRYVELPADQAVKASILDSTPVYDFPTGKSHFVAYRLPRSATAGTNLNVRTFWAAVTLEKPQVFCPSITFYDAGFQAISTELLMLSYQQDQTEARGFWRSILPVPDGAEYLAIHVESRRVGNLLAVSTGGNSPGLLMIGANFAHHSRGGPGQAKYQCGHIGEVTLELARQ